MAATYSIITSNRSLNFSSDTSTYDITPICMGIINVDTSIFVGNALKINKNNIKFFYHPNSDQPPAWMRMYLSDTIDNNTAIHIMLWLDNNTSPKSRHIEVSIKNSISKVRLDIIQAGTSKQITVKNMLSTNTKTGSTYNILFLNTDSHKFFTAPLNNKPIAANGGTDIITLDNTIHSKGNLSTLLRLGNKDKQYNKRYEEINVTNYTSDNNFFKTVPQDPTANIYAISAFVHYQGNASNNMIDLLYDKSLTNDNITGDSFNNSSALSYNDLKELKYIQLNPMYKENQYQNYVNVLISKNEITDQPLRNYFYDKDIVYVVGHRQQTVTNGHDIIIYRSTSISKTSSDLLVRCCVCKGSGNNVFNRPDNPKYVNYNIIGGPINRNDNNNNNTLSNLIRAINNNQYDDNQKITIFTFRTDSADTGQWNLYILCYRNNAFTNVHKLTNKNQIKCVLIQENRTENRNIYNIYSNQKPLTDGQTVSSSSTNIQYTGGLPYLFGSSISFGQDADKFVCYDTNEILRNPYTKERTIYYSYILKIINYNN